MEIGKILYYVLNIVYLIPFIYLPYSIYFMIKGNKKYINKIYNQGFSFTRLKQINKIIIIAIFCIVGIFSAIFCKLDNVIEYTVAIFTTIIATFITTSFICGEFDRIYLKTILVTGFKNEEIENQLVNIYKVQLKYRPILSLINWISVFICMTLLSLSILGYMNLFSLPMMLSVGILFVVLAIKKTNKQLISAISNLKSYPMYIDQAVNNNAYKTVDLKLPGQNQFKYQIITIFGNQKTYLPEIEITPYTMFVLINPKEQMCAGSLTYEEFIDNFENDIEYDQDKAYINIPTVELYNVVRSINESRIKQMNMMKMGG